MKNYYPKMAIFLISIFLILFVLDSFILNGLLLQWGTLNKEKLFLNNQWWRVITSPFFHTGIIHILVNSLAIYCTGILIESKIRSIWFLLIFLISNILERIIFVFAFSPISSIGSSPGIFGLMGVLLIYCWRDREFFKHVKNRGLEFLIGYSILGNVIGFSYDRFFVHAVGFIIGIALGIALNSVFIAGNKEMSRIGK
ncbi:rhomboid family intramembrane serine protease [Paenibacillus sp. FJAT-26967]|uniref:rhomboid family intramembrane serine protease n=1 Tax=Paenibacillus sp. FJAT-26967 TaxID=1729690 RepID=UPI000839A5F1|nr:rhomboid family intramembrane serine protease [Paenibacillus sp. FJAT-26967]